MPERELREKTSCTEINTEQGNLINSTTTWYLTADLVTRVNIPIETLKCHKRTNNLNAFLPIPQMTMEESLDLCHKFGEDVHIAGQFNSKEDFDHYYDGKRGKNVFKKIFFTWGGGIRGLLVICTFTGLQRNEMYVEECGYYDNGRLLTWLPYKINNDSSDLVHDITQEKLLGEQEDKYYVNSYSGPKGNSEWSGQCVQAYFGLVEKYHNILECSCYQKKCTACEIKNSLLETTKLTLRGLCRYSSFDTTYTVQYSPDSMVSYIGVERTIISYNFTLNIWTMRDVTNPAVTAVSEASLRSLAIGNIKWTINNDSKCSQGLDKTDNEIS